MTFLAWRPVPRLFGSFILAIGTLILLHSIYASRIYSQLSPLGYQEPLHNEPGNPTPTVNETLSDSWRKGLSVKQFNEKFTKILQDCADGKQSCPKNGHRLVLLSWGHFALTLEGWVQGENIWCGAMMDAIHALGYSMLIVQPQNIREAIRALQGNVHLIVHDPEYGDNLFDSASVYADTGSHVDLSTPPPPLNSTHLNLPIWKIFHPHWWNNAVGPLGGPFTLSPEPYNMWPEGYDGGKDNFYLGYSVEPSCMQTPLVPHNKRPRQAYIFGKYLGYFMLPDYMFWDEKKGIPGSIADDIYLEVSRTENVTFLAGKFNPFKVPEEYKSGLPRGIIEHDRLPREEFQAVVANSRALIGLGNPFLSPTPYEALCLGIPFIQGIKRNGSKDRKWWAGQHNALIYDGLDEPYAYYVEQGDREAFKAAVRKAMQNPIERYIPPRMTSSAFLQRMKTLLETDWRPVSRKQIELLGYKHRS